jgi:gliding motility-associated-like protein
VAFAYDTITYTLTYTDPNGCSSSDNITLYVLPVSQVFFPNAFTPNGDGNNDIYYSYGGSIKYITLTIFNRWGEKVFDSNNQFVGWDGNYKGKPQPPGVYVYLAKVVLLNDEERNFTGSLTLIR